MPLVRIKFMLECERLVPIVAFALPLRPPPRIVFMALHFRIVRGHSTSRIEASRIACEREHQVRVALWLDRFCLNSCSVTPFTEAKVPFFQRHPPRRSSLSYALRKKESLKRDSLDSKLEEKKHERTRASSSDGRKEKLRRLDAWAWASR